jgi:succinate dehydrogenase / fumarate reductase, iron-sulfur subunit
MILRIFRRSPGQEGSYRLYEIEARQGMTVLDALFQVHDQQDDSLSFRYSCRGAVCGSCAMLINKVPRLACRTQVTGLIDAKPQDPSPSPSIVQTVDRNPSTEVLIEPLPNLPVIKDLIVDMKDFYDKYRGIKPTLRGNDLGDKESPMEQTVVKELERYTNCILCAACYAACPVNAIDPKYVGPAALAKLYRFRIDPRDNEDDRLELADGPHGWWACKFYTNCTKVCPRDVPPNIAIGKARQEITKKKKVTEGTL